MNLKGDQGTTRALNWRLVLNQLRRNGPMSRSEITAAIGLSPAAISFVTADLINEGLLVERSASSSAVGGRRPIPLDIDYSSKVSIGFKVTEKRVVGVLTDLATRPLASIDVPSLDHRPETIVRIVADCVSRLVAKAEIKDDRVIGVGLAIPGQVDVEAGVCRQLQRFDWHDAPIAALLAKMVDAPIWVDNNVNAFTVSQHLFGHGRGFSNIVGIAVGRGIGAGLVLDGRIYRGAGGAAGEFGHSLAVPGGRRCECGRDGCLEAYCADIAMLDIWAEIDPAMRDATSNDLAAAAAAGDPVARKILADAGTMLGRHIAGLVNVVDPEIIVFGGEGVAFGRHLFDPLRRELAGLCYGGVPRIAVDWQDDSWSRGAAALAIQHFFDFEITGGYPSRKTAELPMSA